MGYPSNTLPSSHPQHPKTPLPFPASFYISRAAPDALPLTVIVINSTVALATVPGEPTATAGLRIERAIKEETGAEHCIVLGFCGDYAGYWVTEEEYDEQLYEGSSMIFGKVRKSEEQGWLERSDSNSTFRLPHNKQPSTPRYAPRPFGRRFAPPHPQHGLNVLTKKLRSLAREAVGVDGTPMKKKIKGRKV